MANEKRLIDANLYKGKLIRELNKTGKYTAYESGLDDAILYLDEQPTVEAVPVVHGRWELEVRSFYVDTWDESCELAVYILASCSECKEKHPNSHQVFSKHLYEPEDADEDFRFDKKAEMAKAIIEFKQRGYNFANYCPHCGADMRDGDGNGNL